MYANVINYNEPITDKYVYFWSMALHINILVHKSIIHNRLVTSNLPLVKSFRHLYIYYMYVYKMHRRTLP